VLLPPALDQQPSQNSSFVKNFTPTTEGDRANRESAAGRNAREHGRCLREPRYRVGLARSLHNPPEPKRDNGPQVGGVRQLWVPCGRCGARITVSSKRCDPPPVLAPDGPRMAHTRVGLTLSQDVASDALLAMLKQLAALPPPGGQTIRKASHIAQLAAWSSVEACTVMWLRAASSTLKLHKERHVERWEDISGRGNHAFACSGQRAPTYVRVPPLPTLPPRRRRVQRHRPNSARRHAADPASLAIFGCRWRML